MKIVLQGVIIIFNFTKKYNKTIKVRMSRRKNKPDEEFDILKKIIIIGDSGVGKSNILLRYS